MYLNLYTLQMSVYQFIVNVIKNRSTECTRLSWKIKTKQKEGLINFITLDLKPKWMKKKINEK